MREYAEDTTTEQTYRARFADGSHAPIYATSRTEAHRAAKFGALSRGGSYVMVCAQCDAELHPRRSRLCQPCALACGIAEGRDPVVIR